MNASWLKALAQYPNEFDMHDLYQTFQPTHFDIAKEQAFLLV